MKKIFNDLYQELKESKNAVLCSIIASSGSVPRGKGAKMLVKNDGSITGTIGGGLVEYNAINIAKEILNTRENSKRTFSLNRDDVKNLGMVCGGDVTVYFRFFSCESNNDLEFSKYVSEMFDEDKSLWLITETNISGKNQIGTYTKEDGIKFIDINYNDVEQYIFGKAYLKNDSFFIEPLITNSKVYIFGGGHVSQALAPVLSNLNFNVVVLDDRKEFTNPSLFNNSCNTKLIDFHNINLSISVDDYIIIMTRGHECDFDILEFALKSPSLYIGLIGSRKKWEYTTEKLKEDGFTENDWSRVYNPIGIEIYAQTPEEIAISIAAQLIMKRAKST